MEASTSDAHVRFPKASSCGLSGAAGASRSKRIRPELRKGPGLSAHFAGRRPRPSGSQGTTGRLLALPVSTPADRHRRRAEVAEQLAVPLLACACLRQALLQRLSARFNMPATGPHHDVHIELLSGTRQSNRALRRPRPQHQRPVAGPAPLLLLDRAPRSQAPTKHDRSYCGDWGDRAREPPEAPKAFVLPASYDGILGTRRARHHAQGVRGPGPRVSEDQHLTWWQRCPQHPQPLQYPEASPAKGCHGWRTTASCRGYPADVLTTPTPLRHRATPALPESIRTGHRWCSRDVAPSAHSSRSSTTHSVAQSLISVCTRGCTQGPCAAVVPCSA